MRRIISIIVIIVMTKNLYSQEMPAIDRISTPAGTLELHFIGHGSLMFKLNSIIVYVDPVRSIGKYDGLPKADMILVTHDHGDHLDPSLINDLRKESSSILCNARSAPSVEGARSISPGAEFTGNGVTVEAVHAYNIKNVRPDGNPYHPKGDGNGYVITLGGKRIYVAGDTENIPELKQLENIDVAFLPMNLPFTMTPEMVADAAKSFSPSILYPYHFGNTNTDIIKGLLKDTGIELRIRNLQ